MLSQGLLKIIIFIVIYVFQINCVYAKNLSLAIMNFNCSGISFSEANSISDIIRHTITKLIESQDYKKQSKDLYLIVERAEIEKVLDQFEFQNFGCVSDSCAVQFGKMLQVDRIVIGSISLLGGKYIITARMVDVESSKQISSGICQNSNSIDSLIEFDIPSLCQQILGVKKIKYDTYITKSTKNIKKEIFNIKNIFDPNKAYLKKDDITINYGKCLKTISSNIDINDIDGFIIGSSYKANYNNTSSLELGFHYPQKKIDFGFDNGSPFVFNANVLYHPLYFFLMPYVTVGINWSFILLKNDREFIDFGYNYGYGAIIPINKSLQFYIDFRFYPMRGTIYSNGMENEIGKKSFYLKEIYIGISLNTIEYIGI